MIETLENRLLMRGGVIGLEGRTVYVSGTAGDDVITLMGSTKRVVVRLNGKTQEFVGRDVRRVIVYSGAGNDYVDAGANLTLPNFRALTVPTYIDGGTGSDSLNSGLKADTLLGGNGNDFLSGDMDHDGGDYHDGGIGDDRMSYGGTMNGGRGYDVATGDNGNDPIVSGVELLDTISDGRGSSENPYVIDRAEYRGDLSTRGGRLLFRFPTTSGYQTSLSTPIINDDGVVQMTLKSRFIAQDFRQPEEAVKMTLDVAEATRRGIVLKYDDLNGVFSSSDQQWVLIPPAN